MSTPRTSMFLKNLQASGLVDERQLAEIAERSAGARDDRALARHLVAEGTLTRYQAEQILAGRAQGFVIGPYVVIDRIGAGAMGRVFKAIHRHMQRTVAIKVLTGSRRSDPIAQARFLREVRASAQLHHPNIVAAYDVGEERDVTYLVMEYVDGIDLFRLITKQGKLDPERAAEIARQVALALEHARQKGIVHRDVKPSNILIDPEGTAKVLDMGLARFENADKDVDDSTAITRDGVVMGTLDYLAPEQALDSHTADTRADIYSLGCTLYHMLTGQVPFPGGAAAEKLMKHQVKEPEPLTALAPAVPTHLAAIVARMTAKRPQARFQTPVEAAEELQAFLTGQRASAPAPVLLDEPGPTPADRPQVVPDKRERARRSEQSSPSDRTELRAPMPPPVQPVAPAPAASMDETAQVADQPAPVAAARERWVSPLVLVALAPAAMAVVMVPVLVVVLMRQPGPAPKGEHGRSGSGIVHKGAPGMVDKGESASPSGLGPGMAPKVAPGVPRAVATKARGPLREKGSSPARPDRKGSGPATKGPSRVAPPPSPTQTELDGQVALLKHPDPKVRRSAANKLGELADPRAVDPLVVALMDQDHDARKSAAKALVKIGAPAVESLAVALTTSDRRGREAALGVLQTLRWTPTSPREQAFYLLTVQQWNKLEALGPVAIEPFIAALKHDDQDVRRRAAQVLGKLGDRRAVMPLAEALKDVDPGTGRAAANALGQLKDPSAVRALLAVSVDRPEAPTGVLLVSEESNVGQAAVEAVAKMGAAAVEPLVAALKDTNPRVKASAAQALVRIGAPAGKALVAALSDRDWGPRDAVADVLVKIGSPAVEAIVDGLDDADDDTLGLFAKVLGTMGTPGVRGLTTALRHPDPAVRGMGVKALGNVRSRQAVRALLSALRDRDPKVRALAAQTLGRSGDKQAVGPLIAALKDRATTVRAASAEALGRLCDKRALKPLKAAVRDRELSVRMAASSALSRVRRYTERAPTRGRRRRSTRTED